VDPPLLDMGFDYTSPPYKPLDGRSLLYLSDCSRHRSSINLVAPPSNLITFSPRPSFCFQGSSFQRPLSLSELTPPLFLHASIYRRLILPHPWPSHYRIMPPPGFYVCVRRSFPPFIYCETFFSHHTAAVVQRRMVGLCSLIREISVHGDSSIGQGRIRYQELFLLARLLSLLYDAPNWRSLASFPVSLVSASPTPLFCQGFSP